MTDKFAHLDNTLNHQWTTHRRMKVMAKVSLGDGRYAMRSVQLNPRTGNAWFYAQSQNPNRKTISIPGHIREYVDGLTFVARDEVDREWLKTKYVAKRRSMGSIISERHAAQRTALLRNT